MQFIAAYLSFNHISAALARELQCIVDAEQLLCQLECIGIQRDEALAYARSSPLPYSDALNRLYQRKRGMLDVW